nr:hypothetical protein [Nocardioides astragali]
MEVEGGLGPGEVAEGGSPSGVEGLGGAEGLAPLGAVGQDAVDVEGVGQVDLRLDPYGAGEVDVLAVNRDVPRVHGQVAVIGVRRRIRWGELEALDALWDQPVELGGADASGDGRDLGIDPPGRLRSQRRGGVDRGFGHHPGPPRRDPTRLHLRPQPREPVPQLQGVPDQPLRRHRRDPEDGAELGDAELRHRRAALTGDGFLVLTSRHGEGRRHVDRLRRMEVRPAGGEVELTGSFGVLDLSRGLDRGEQTGGVEVSDLCLASPCKRPDHVFDSRDRH